MISLRAWRCPHPRGRRARRGMTLIEVMVVIAIIVLVSGSMVVGVREVFGLEERAEAKKLALAYERLHDEAILRNMNFRLKFDFTANSWEIQVGEPGVMIFEDADAREEGIEAEEDFLDDLSEAERAKYNKRNAFRTLQGTYGGTHELPAGLLLGSVYTPQHEDPITIDSDPDRSTRRGKGDEEEERGPVAYSHVFSSGHSEKTVITLIEKDDEEAGYTIVVDPLSGQVTLHHEIVDYRDLFDFVPDEGPKLAL